MQESFGFIKGAFWAVFAYSIIAFAIPIAFNDIFSYHAYNVSEPVYQILLGEDLSKVMPWESNQAVRSNSSDEIVLDSVNVTEIIIWNAGKKVIENKEILRDFEIISPDSTKIIGYDIVQKTEYVDKKLALFQSDNNCLSINWSQLGPQQGFTAKIFIEGITSDKLEFNGKLIKNEFKRVKLSPDFDPWVHFYYCFACLFFVYISYFGIKKELKGDVPGPLRLIFFGAAVLAILVYIPNFYNFYYEGYFAPRILLK